MLTIRTQQLRELEEASSLHSAQELRRVVQRSTHASLEALDEAGVESAVAEGTRRAHSYGLSGREEMMSFMALIAKCGLAFESDPELAWIRAQLTDPLVANPARRLALVMDRMARREQIAEQNRKVRSMFAQHMERLS